MGRGAGSSKKFGNGARSKRNYQGARGKIKKEQGAKRYEKGAVKMGKMERAPKNAGKGAGRTGQNVKGSREPQKADALVCMLTIGSIGSSSSPVAFANYWKLQWTRGDALHCGGSIRTSTAMQPI